MSDDVSLARPAGRLTPSPAESSDAVMKSQQADTWTTGLTGFWEFIFAATIVGVSVLTLVVEQDTKDRVTLAVVMAMMAAWYLILGRQVVTGRRPRWQGYLFQAVLLALFTAALSESNLVAYLLFALSPLIYMTLPLRAGHAAIVAYGLAPAVAYLATTGNVGVTVSMVLPIGLVVIALSIVFAMTTSRTRGQSAERAVLIEQLASSRAEVARLSHEAGVVQERQRLAGDIHDTIAQGLSSVVMLVEAASGAMTSDPKTARKHLDLAARTARENLEEARAIVGALTPGPLAGTSLEDALRRATVRFGTETDLPTSFEVDGAARALSTGIEVVLLRVVQEALTNVRKHAGAHRARVRLSFTGDGVVVEVRDDGAGFDMAALHSGYGLGAMRGRVEQVGGRLTVHSAHLDGTTVRTEIDT